VYAGSTTGYLHGWTVHDAAPTRAGPPAKVADDLVEAIAYHPEGRLVGITSDDGLVRLVDVSRPGAPRVVATVDTDAGVAYGVRFSPDGRLLAFATEARGGFVFDVSDPDHPRQVARVTGIRGAVYTTAFNRDSTMAAFAGADYSTHVVDLTTPGTPRTLTHPLTGPVGEVYEIAFNPARDELAVSSIDGTIRVWDLTERTAPALRATLTAAADGLFTVSYSPEGATLVGAGRDPAVRLWMTDPAAVARWICATVGDPITRAEWDQFVPDLPFHPPCR
jgi:WD40 repeat protein